MTNDRKNEFGKLDHDIVEPTVKKTHIHRGYPNCGPSSMCMLRKRQTLEFLFGLEKSFDFKIEVFYKNRSKFVTKDANNAKRHFAIQISF